MNKQEIEIYNRGWRHAMEFILEKAKRMCQADCYYLEQIIKKNKKEVKAIPPQAKASGILALFI